MYQTIHVVFNVVPKQGYDSFVESPFNKIGYRIAHQVGGENVNLCESEADVEGDDILHGYSSVSSPLPNVGTYSEKDSNPSPVTYEQDICLNGASGYEYCQETNHRDKYDTTKQFIAHRKNDGTQESRS